MPCFATKEMHQRLHPVQIDQMRIEQVEKNSNSGKMIEKTKSFCSRPFANNKEANIDFERAMHDECKQVYRAKGMNERELRRKFQERHNMQQLQQQLARLNTTESSTAMGRNIALRLQQQEKSMNMRLIAQKQPVVTQRELERLKKAAKVLTVEERLDALAREEKETKQMQRTYERERLRFKEMDEAKRRAIELKGEQEDLWGNSEKMKVLERAFLARHEQEEDVKRVNQIILNAKCHAVRDAQIQEKTELQRALRMQQNQLERQVNENAVKALAAEDLGEEKQRIVRAQYARQIREQLEERETLRFLEAERIEQEAKVLREANEAMKREEERLKTLERERRAQLRAELTAVVEMSNLFKKMLCEQEREADMRIAAYMKEKQERERALVAEKKEAREAQLRNQQRIYELAQKIIDSKSEREEVTYMREQERLEREYRRKELEAAQRKKQLEHDLNLAREMQLKETQHRQALQVAREEKDFNMLIDGLKRDETKQRQKEENREQNRRCYRAQIIQQIGDKELERRRLRELELEQANAWRESERRRDVNIQTVINSKLQAMRDACLPEKYVRDVELQLKRINYRKNKLN